MVPFFILGTPRSRTAWLAEFLSTTDRRVDHEPSQHFSCMQDLWDYLARPGCAASDSLMTLRWKHITAMVPDARFVVVRRPIPEVVASFTGIGVRHHGLERMLRRIEAETDQMATEVPVLRVPFSALALRSAADDVYRHCRGVPMPAGHWERWGRRNVQADLKSVLAATRTNASGLSRVFPELMEAA
jgi:hypothetical protein